jgi:phosphate transport system substrate-binding protein
VIITKRLAALSLAGLLAVAACGGGNASPTGDALGGTAAAGLSGSINISGSSTVQPISQGIAELFNETNPGVAIRVDGPGTGDGFELFCNGETDISDASRAIREAEIAACEENGVEYVELKVAIDGLSVLTAPANEAVSCLSYADLYALIGPESEGFANWQDAQALATELGSTTQLPDAPLEISGPGEESGTYDYFVEEVMGEYAEDRGQEEVTRKDYNSSPNDNVIIQGIEGFDTSLGWVGYAFAIEAGDQVKLLEVSGPDGGCVAPTPDTIASTEYPLSRDLFIYVSTANAEENDALAAYVDFYLAEENLSLINDEVGYVNLESSVLDEQRAAWDGR